MAWTKKLTDRLGGLACFGAFLTLFACPSNPVKPVEPIVKSSSTSNAGGFTNFETEPVQPLALSADGKFLYALNTADDRLEIFDAAGESPRSVGETPVGLRPVALALREGQAWVVNHLSDSVSVVDIRDPARPRVVHTLPTGDEPRGIVVGGPRRNRVFVAAARRDQSLTPGLGRAQIWIFDGDNPIAPPQVLTLFSAKPRALAVSPDGRWVYAASFLSGNRTASVSGEDAVRYGRAAQIYHDRVPWSSVPKQGAIVKQSARGWRDFDDRDWSAALPFELPDYDIFVIDAAADQPRVTRAFSGVGTVLFNLAVHPISRELWVSNTEALNFIAHEPRLRGRFARNRITRIVAPERDDSAIAFADLNSHLDGEIGEVTDKLRALGLAQPLDIVFRPDGNEAYVAAFGSGKVALLDAQGKVIGRVATGAGPAGLALDAMRRRLYVLHHLGATIAVVDIDRRAKLSEAPLRYNPTPAALRSGRAILYDAALTSRYGDLSCAICHVFGDMDGIAWDLGDPAGAQIDIPARLQSTGLSLPRQPFHPLKGPMVTQSLRGLEGAAPYHWRGDRFGEPLQPGGDIASFKDFNAAFVDLLGRGSELSDAAIDSLARFAMTIRYPPNPNQNLDRSLTVEQRAGFEFFAGPFLSGAGQQNCESCHRLPLGTNGLVNFEGEQIGRDMKTAHLRNVYDKVGRFNVAGPQVSGFGLTHDGALDTVVSFLRLDVFFFPGKTAAEKDALRRRLHEYIMAFDTGMAPAVGRQVTIDGMPAENQQQLLDLLARRAHAGDCDLIAHGWEGAVLRGWLYRQGAFLANRTGDEPVTLPAILARYRRAKEPLTFTCVPPGDGWRSALDRNLDRRLDGDESPAANVSGAAQSLIQGFRPAS